MKKKKIRKIVKKKKNKIIENSKSFNKESKEENIEKTEMVKKSCIKERNNNWDEKDGAKSGSTKCWKKMLNR